MSGQAPTSVLVTAANGGLGLGMVGALLDSGRYEIYGTYRNDPSALEELFASRGLDASRRVLRADLNSYEETVAALEEAGRQFPLWGLVNLAGRPSAARLADMPAEEAASIAAENFVPALNTTKAAIELIGANPLPGGRVVQASSVTVRRPVPGTAPYVAGKAAVEGLVRACAEEGGRHGVTVNALRLGYFSSGMGALVPEPILERVVKASAVRRVGEAGDLAAAVLGLLSEDSGFQTGTVVDLDGGLV